MMKIWENEQEIHLRWCVAEAQEEGMIEGKDEVINNEKAVKHGVEK